MKRFLAPAVITVAAITLAACDSNEDAASVATEAAADGGASPAPLSTVSVTQIEGFGKVLTDTEGRTLYMADEEADHDVVCTDACEEFWAPFSAGSETPTGAGVDNLGVAERPDGSTQVTLDGRRLYTFTQESAGEVAGDGLSDTFGDQRFTWHAAVVDEAATTPGEDVGTSGTADEMPERSDPSGGYPGYDR